MTKAIEVHQLGKKYNIGALQQDRPEHLTEIILAAAKLPFQRMGRLLQGNQTGAADLDQEFWALRDVSFGVDHGEVVGIIGRNGAGKSTLLKILSQITEPSEGWARLAGRAGSLLEVGTGFNDELTGRENVYLNGSILGMRRGEIARKFDEIVDFAGVEQFIDTPVKHYSSGMKVRLAFAVAAHLEPEILIIDEVLAVGDLKFQQKCLGKMNDITREGRTVLFVSHNMASVQALCNRVILLADGQIVDDGETDHVIQRYYDTLATTEDDALAPDHDDWKARYTHLTLFDHEQKPAQQFTMGAGFTVELQFETRVPLINPSFGVIITDRLGQNLLRLITYETHGNMPEARQGGTVRLSIEHLNLLPGTYYLRVGLSDSREQYVLIDQAAQIQIIPRQIYPTGKLPPSARSIIYAPCSWEHDYS